MRNFKNLKVWQRGMEIVKKTYLVASQLPVQERYGLCSQICKAAVSIPSNIAEGSAKRSKKDYQRYLDIAFGSSFELETELLVIDMLNFCDKDMVIDLLRDIDEEQKMLQGLIKTIEND